MSLGLGEDAKLDLQPPGILKLAHVPAADQGPVGRLDADRAQLRRGERWAGDGDKPDIAAPIGFQSVDQLRIARRGDDHQLLVRMCLIEIALDRQGQAWRPAIGGCDAGDANLRGVSRIRRGRRIGCAQPGRKAQGQAIERGGGAKPAAVPIVDHEGLARIPLPDLQVEDVAVPALVLGEGIEHWRRQHRHALWLAEREVGAGQQERAGLVEHAGGVDRLDDVIAHLAPERMAGDRRDERGAKDPAKAALPDQGLGLMRVGLEADGELASGQQRLERPQAFAVQVGIDAAEGLKHEVAAEIGAADRRPIAAVHFQQFGIAGRDELIQIAVGPQPDLPTGISRSPGFPQRGEAGRDVLGLPQLVERGGDRHDPWRLQRSRR